MVAQVHFLEYYSKLVILHISRLVYLMKLLSSLVKFSRLFLNCWCNSLSSAKLCLPNGSLCTQKYNNLHPPQYQSEHLHKILLLHSSIEQQRRPCWFLCNSFAFQVAKKRKNNRLRLTFLGRIKNEKISLENGLSTFRILISVNDTSFSLFACEPFSRNGLLA